jgi:hypothetical protein
MKALIFQPASRRVLRESTLSHGSSEVDEKRKVDVHDEEIAVARLTEEDLYRLSQESLSFKGKAAFRITLIMIVMGCNQAGKSTYTLANFR